MLEMTRKIHDKARVNEIAWNRVTTELEWKADQIQKSSYGKVSLERDGKFLSNIGQELYASINEECVTLKKRRGESNKITPSCGHFWMNTCSFLALSKFPPLRLMCVSDNRNTYGGIT